MIRTVIECAQCRKQKDYQEGGSLRRLPNLPEGWLVLSLSEQKTEPLHFCSKGCLVLWAQVPTKSGMITDKCMNDLKVLTSHVHAHLQAEKDLFKKRYPEVDISCCITMDARIPREGEER